MGQLHVRKRLREQREPLTLDGKDAISIGRSSANDLVLSSRAVSRQHCVIERVDGVVQVRDLGSHYGTRVNGERVQTLELHDGDVITVGRFEVAYTDAKASRSRPAAGAGEPDPASRGAASAETQHALAEVRAELAEVLETLKRERVERDRERAGTDEQEGVLETQREAALEDERREHAALREALETQLESLRSRHEETSAERDTLVTRVAELERQNETLGGELERVQQERSIALDGETAAQSLVTSQQTSIQRLDTERKTLEEQWSDAQRHLAGFQSVAAQVTVGAQRLAARRRRVRELEARWLELDELVSEGEGDGSPADPRLVASHAQLAADLEAAHEAREEAVEQLELSLEQLQRIHATASAGGGAPASRPASPSRSRRFARRPWLATFGVIALTGIAALLWWMSRAS